MDIRKIKKLIELLEESDLLEMEIVEGEESIRLSRTSSAPLMQSASTGQMVNAPPVIQTPGALKDDDSLRSVSVSSGYEVKSPMVGTYYDAATPGGKSFVKVGDSVNTGDTICIIEAMKIFNQIEAEKSGVIKAVFKSTGDPVEYDEPMFIIE